MVAAPTTPRTPDALLGALLPLVTAWCLRLGGGRIDAEAAAQDALLVLLRRADDLRPDAPIEPWAWGVTRKVVADHRRRAWLRRWVPGLSAEPTHADSPERRAGQSERARQVQQVLNSLSTDHAEVLILCDAEERTDAEVARILDLPLGTLKSRLRAARAAFRAQAQHQGLTALAHLEPDHV